MNQKSNQLAKELSFAEEHLSSVWEPVFKSQRVVPLFLGGSAAFDIGAMGILKAGMAFCPLPLDAPAQRLIDILDDVQACVVLGMGRDPFPGIIFSTLPAEARERLESIIWVDMSGGLAKWPNHETLDSALGSLSSSSAALRTPGSEDLAYILYTSGSTGKPKGALISHSNAATSIHVHAEAFEPFPSGADLRWLQFAMPTFDSVVLEVFLTLSYGGTICIADRRLVLSDVEAAINFFRANTVMCVPTMATLIRPKNVPTLKHIICGGEALTKYAIDNFSGDSGIDTDTPQKRLINIYGPTEASVSISSCATQIGYRGSIAGRVYSGCTVLIVDDERRDELVSMPVSLSGEIVLAGPLVGQGYLNRPTESATAFVSGLGYERAYRTGDKGRIVWSADGVPQLEILGRLNMDQVKLNARRVELGEIESAIANQVPELREIATAVVGGRFLAAYIVLKQWTMARAPREAVIAQCRAAAENGLPEWMRPAEYTVLPAILGMIAGKPTERSSGWMQSGGFAGRLSSRCRRRLMATMALWL